MSEEKTSLSMIHTRLSITREAELLQSFIGVTIDDDKEVSKEELSKETKPDEDPKETGETTEEKKKGNENSDAPVQEIKKKLKKKRKRSKHEELYCDKDRAAAVNMGSKDIKQSLKLKRKQDRSKILQIPEEAEPGTFLALGNYEMCRGDIRIAVGFITKALELNPAEKNALVARSKCYILLGQPEKALEDAETALNIDKCFLRAIYQKAEALYYLGDFEHSLMYYHRGLHLRPDNEEFTLGVHKARKAIENAIGPSCTVFKFLMSKSSRKTDASISSNEKASPVSKTSTKSRSGRKSRLLRELEPDKEYLDNLIKNPNLKCKFNEHDSTIVETIEATVKYLNNREEFWRQQLPANLK